MLSGVTVVSLQPVPEFGDRHEAQARPGLPLPLASSPCLTAQDGFL